MTSERNRLLWLALRTSLVARLSGICLQLVSLPIAAAALGPAGFSIYSMVGAVVGWMMLSNFGVPQAITLHIANIGGANANPRRVIEIFSAGVVLTVPITLAVAAICTTLVFSPLSELAFKNHTGAGHSSRYPLIFSIGVFLALQSVSIFEAAQLAAQKQHKTNVALAAGTAIAAILTYWVARNHPSILGILAAVHLPALVARALNSYHISKEINLSSGKLKEVKQQDIKELLRDGASFFSGGTLGHFLSHSFTILAIGTLSPPENTASFAAVMNAIILISSVYNLLLTPYRGALPEAWRNNDVEWIRKAYSTTMRLSLAIGTVAALAFSIAGEEIFSVWFQDTIHPTKELLIGAGLYILLLGFEVTNYSFLASLGHVRRSSKWLLAKSACSAVLVTALAAQGISDLSLLAMALTNVFLSLAPLSIKVHKTLSVLPQKLDRQ